MRTARTHGGKTARTWAKEGFIVLPGELPESCYTNQYCQHIADYFRADQVREASEDELREFFRPEREARNEAARVRRANRSSLNRIHKAAQQVASNYKGEPYQKIIFDLETTGLDPYKDEILQISIINDKGETLLNEYVRPYKAKSWHDAEAVNGISPEKVRNCKHIDYYAEKIQKIFLSATELIAYNGNFDMDFLSHIGLIIPDVPYYDVMLEFAPIYGEWSQYHEDYKWQKLITCARYFNYEFKAHDSLEDVRATLHCYKKLHAEEG